MPEPLQIGQSQGGVNGGTSPYPNAHPVWLPSPSGTPLHRGGVIGEAHHALVGARVCPFLLLPVVILESDPQCNCFMNRCAVIGGIQCERLDE